MSGTLNKVLLIGNLGDDVKIHYFDNGGCVGRFPIATSESYTNKEGEKIVNTEWHNIIVRNKAAEVCEKYTKKGDKIYIEGRIRTRQWTDDTGNNRYTTEIIATDFTFLTPKDSKETSTFEKNDKRSNENSKMDEKSSTEDDLPF